MNETAAEIRDRAIAENGLLRQHNAELRNGLAALLSRIIDDRDATYEFVTDSLGNYSSDAQGDVDRKTIAEFDALIDRTRALLGKVVP